MAEPKSSQVLMRELIQRITAFDLADEDIVLGAVEALGTPLHGGNTKITVDIRLPDNFWYSRTIYYNRLNLTTLFTGKDMNFAADEPATATALADLINARFGLGMDAGDYVSEVIGSGRFHTFKAKVDSLVYVGQVNVEVHPLLDDDTIPAGVTESFNIELDGAFVDGNGDLKAIDNYDDPSGNGHFYTQENSEFRVAVRLYDDWNWTTDISPERVYDFTGGLWNNESWYSLDIGLQAKGATTILADYDIKLVIRENTNPANAPVWFDLVADGAGMKFTNGTTEIPFEFAEAATAITEFNVNEDELPGLVLPGAVRGWHGTLLGNYKFRVQVQRKSDGVVIVNAPVYANAPSAGIFYPWRKYNTDLSTESLATAFVDANGFLVTDSNSPDTNFMFSQGAPTEPVALALRPAVNPDAPTAATRAVDNTEEDHLYRFENVAANGDTWYVDMFADLSSTTIRGNLGATPGVGQWMIQFAVMSWGPPGITPTGDEMIADFRLSWNGTTYVFTDSTGRFAAFSPDWVSADGLKFGKRLDIRTFQSYMPSYRKDANNLPMYVRLRLTAQRPTGGNWASDAHTYVKAFSTYQPI